MHVWRARTTVRRTAHSRADAAASLTSICLLTLSQGLLYPLLTVSIHLGDIELFHQTRSVLSTIKFLHEEKADLPAALILIFSVFVPIIKFIMLLFIALWPTNLLRRQLFYFVKTWSKWSMADVFVTGQSSVG
jgi:uncharacterized paraquat-inducible protein A